MNPFKQVKKRAYKYLIITIPEPPAPATKLSQSVPQDGMRTECLGWLSTEYLGWDKNGVPQDGLSMEYLRMG